MRVELVLPGIEHAERYTAMMDEWIAFGGRLNPGALRSNGRPYDVWLRWMREDRDEATCPEGSPPQTLYFVMEDEVMLGAVTIRHRLNERTRVNGGYIGYGIRPGARGRGYATKALDLAMVRLREMGVDGDILLTCEEDNAASERVMRKLGAQYGDTVTDEDGKRIRRLWLRNTP